MTSVLPRYSHVTIDSPAQSPAPRLNGDTLYNAHMLNGQFCFVVSSASLYPTQRISIVDLSEVFGTAAVQFYKTFRHNPSPAQQRAAQHNNPLDAGRDVVFGR
jgi:hypothetical protein